MPTYLDPPEFTPPSHSSAAAQPDTPEDPYSIGIWPSRHAPAASAAELPSLPDAVDPVNPMIPAGLPAGPEPGDSSLGKIPPDDPTSHEMPASSDNYSIAVWHHFQRTPGLILPATTMEAEVASNEASPAQGTIT